MDEHLFKYRSAAPLTLAVQCIHNVIYFMSNCPEIIFLLLNYLLNEIYLEIVSIRRRGVIYAICIICESMRFRSDHKVSVYLVM